MEGDKKSKMTKTGTGVRRFKLTAVADIVENMGTPKSALKDASTDAPKSAVKDASTNVPLHINTDTSTATHGDPSSRSPSPGNTDQAHDKTIVPTLTSAAGGVHTTVGESSTEKDSGGDVNGETDASTSGKDLDADKTSKDTDISSTEGHSQTDMRCLQETNKDTRKGPQGNKKSVEGVGRERNGVVAKKSVQLGSRQSLPQEGPQRPGSPLAVVRKPMSGVASVSVQKVNSSNNTSGSDSNHTQHGAKETAPFGDVTSVRVLPDTVIKDDNAQTGGAKQGGSKSPDVSASAIASSTTAHIPQQEQAQAQASTARKKTPPQAIPERSSAGVKGGGRGIPTPGSLPSLPSPVSESLLLEVRAEAQRMKSDPTHFMNPLSSTSAPVVTAKSGVKPSRFTIYDPNMGVGAVGVNATDVAAGSAGSSKNNSVLNLVASGPNSGLDSAGASTVALANVGSSGQGVTVALIPLATDNVGVAVNPGIPMYAAPSVAHMPDMEYSRSRFKVKDTHPNGVIGGGGGGGVLGSTRPARSQPITTTTLTTTTTDTDLNGTTVVRHQSSNIFSSAGVGMGVHGHVAGSVVLPVGDTSSHLYTTADGVVRSVNGDIKHAENASGLHGVPPTPSRFVVNGVPDASGNKGHAAAHTAAQAQMTAPIQTQVQGAIPVGRFRSLQHGVIDLSHAPPRQLTPTPHHMTQHRMEQLQHQHQQQQHRGQLGSPIMSLVHPHGGQILYQTASNVTPVMYMPSSQSMYSSVGMPLMDDGHPQPMTQQDVLGGIPAGSEAHGGKAMPVGMEDQDMHQAGHGMESDDLNYVYVSADDVSVNGVPVDPQGVHQKYMPMPVNFRRVAQTGLDALKKVRKSNVEQQKMLKKLIEFHRPGMDVISSGTFMDKLDFMKEQFVALNKENELLLENNRKLRQECEKRGIKTPDPYTTAVTQDNFSIPPIVQAPQSNEQFQPMMMAPVYDEAQGSTQRVMPMPMQMDMGHPQHVAYVPDMYDGMQMPYAHAGSDNQVPMGAYQPVGAYHDMNYGSYMTAENGDLNNGQSHDGFAQTAGYEEFTDWRSVDNSTEFDHRASLPEISDPAANNWVSDFSSATVSDGAVSHTQDASVDWGSQLTNTYSGMDMNGGYPHAEVVGVPVGYGLGLNAGVPVHVPIDSHGVYGANGLYTTHPPVFQQAAIVGAQNTPGWMYNSTSTLKQENSAPTQPVPQSGQTTPQTQTQAQDHLPTFQQPQMRRVTPTQEQMGAFAQAQIPTPVHAVVPGVADIVTSGVPLMTPMGAFPTVPLQQPQQQQQLNSQHVLQAQNMQNAQTLQQAQNGQQSWSDQHPQSPLVQQQQAQLQQQQVQLQHMQYMQQQAQYVQQQAYLQQQHQSEQNQQSQPPPRPRPPQQGSMPNPTPHAQLQQQQNQQREMQKKHVQQLRQQQQQQGQPVAESASKGPSTAVKGSASPTAKSGASSSVRGNAGSGTGTGGGAKAPVGGHSAQQVLQKKQQQQKQIREQQAQKHAQAQATPQQLIAVQTSSMPASNNTNRGQGSSIAEHSRVSASNSMPMNQQQKQQEAKRKSGQVPTKTQAQMSNKTGGAQQTSHQQQRVNSSGGGATNARASLPSLQNTPEPLPNVNMHQSTGHNNNHNQNIAQHNNSNPTSNTPHNGPTTLATLPSAASRGTASQTGELQPISQPQSLLQQQQAMLQQQHMQQQQMLQNRQQQQHMQLLQQQHMVQQQHMQQQMQQHQQNMYNAQLTQTTAGQPSDQSANLNLASHHNASVLSGSMQRPQPQQLHTGQPQGQPAKFNQPALNRHPGQGSVAASRPRTPPIQKSSTTGVSATDTK
ncbi:hypothetical protein SARC_03878 [Sphaeroforma arctica JP610]|uniref:Uncharacterized protein n=1 Tax=Sphaeroforma arctica JP610 TaxID=667725 RepID=A0A0L0G6M5_9EUKA|nr:hypothetical protein SARC_03878 [Sphaeroforma arctica JP610]KNC83888.1 hypothetical protein SARC_03878 [Sphaeroforma arctica JP610]|eukprot:XP_014157790.1 hypothetical protein SARC_03878 [Sphaeroforma arctica JP610]